jgi:hypothetical protein
MCSNLIHKKWERYKKKSYLNKDQLSNENDRKKVERSSNQSNFSKMKLHSSSFIFSTYLLILLFIFLIYTPINFVNAQTSQDDHIFYLKKASTNKCLTITSIKKDEYQVNEDIVCEKTFESQKFLYSQNLEKILVYTIQDHCLQLKDTNTFEIKKCSLTNKFTSPDLTGTTLSLATSTFTSNSISHSNQFEIIRPDGTYLNTAVPFTDCSLRDLEIGEFNSQLEPQNIYGFQNGDKVYWQCMPGYTTPSQQMEIYSSCTETGWNNKNDPIQCIRVQCPTPMAGKGSNVHIYDNNELKILETPRWDDHSNQNSNNEDNKDLSNDNQQNNNLIFLHGDEIIYQCQKNKIPADTDMSDSVTSICGPDRKWTVPPLKCANSCDKTYLIKSDSLNNEKCGYFTTSNYPNYYNADDECVWIIDNEDNNNEKINYKFKDLDLDYNSIFQLQCQKDRVHIFKERPINATENSTDDPKTITKCKTTEMAYFMGLKVGHSMSIEKDAIFQNENNNYLEFQFKSDAQLVGNGIYIEWWTSYYQNYTDVPNSCKFQNPNNNNNDNDAEEEGLDHTFGFIYDIYHAIYIIILMCIMIFLVFVGVKRFYLKCTQRKIEDEDEDSDYDSDEDSDDESDIYDQYDLDQDEDDVDDFSLLTLLEMKANRRELGSAVEKLTKEIDHLEHPDEDDEADNRSSDHKNSSLLTDAPPNQYEHHTRRLSNINKVHGGIK